MKQRKFGRTGHLSTVAIFGGAALWEIHPEDADRAIQTVLDAGVNHFDVAPSYGQAEQHLGRWMPDIRNRIFLGCKTMERSASGARREMEASLTRLNVSMFDLYQLHAVTTLEELNDCTRAGGALEGILAAHDEGLAQHIGITTHGYDAPRLCLEAVRRFPFDSVIFPYNFILAADDGYRTSVEELLRICAADGIGTMVIKSVARGRWGNREHIHSTWYEPFDRLADIQQAVNFVLSQPVTGLCTAGDVSILPKVLEACENLTELDGAGQKALIALAAEFQPLFQPGETG